jgi:hypothetical protein
MLENKEINIAEFQVEPFAHGTVRQYPVVQVEAVPQTLVKAQ